MKKSKDSVSQLYCLKNKGLREKVQKYLKGVDVDGIFSAAEFYTLRETVWRLHSRESQKKAEQMRKERNWLYLEKEDIGIGDLVFHRTHRKILRVEKIEANGFLRFRYSQKGKDPFSYGKLNVRKEDALDLVGWVRVEKSELEELEILSEAVSRLSRLDPQERIYFIRPEKFRKAKARKKRREKIIQCQTKSFLTLGVSAANNF